MLKFDIKAFSICSETNAPKVSTPYLTQAKETFGLIPNVEGVVAQASALITTYMTVWNQFDETSLTEIERQIVYQLTDFKITVNN